MGSAASSTQGPLQRARKIVIIRAYNARPATETLSEQFAKMSRISHTGNKVLSICDIKSAIGLSQPWFDDLLKRIAGNEIGEVDFNSFISFLHDGSMPQVASVAEPKNPTPRGPRRGPMSSFNDDVMPPLEPPILVGFSPLQPSGLASSPVHIISDQDFEPQKVDYKTSHDEEDDDYKHERSVNDFKAIARRSIRENQASNGDAMYPDVFTCLRFREPTQCRDLLPHNGSTLALNRKDSHRKVGPSRPLWRKRETIIHERIVHYTTVDADGTAQELIESEKSQNEIVHLECKETGEFAHRESSKFEQTETFNNEVVAHETGNEEYLHMKSKDDEYEHLESNMPTKMQERAAEEAAAAAAAQAEAEAQARAAAGEGLEPDGMPNVSLHLDPGAERGLPLGADGLPMTQEQFDEDAQRWWEAQQQQQQQQYEQQSQPQYRHGDPSPFDDDAQQWWNAQQQPQHQHQSPGSSHIGHDDDAQQWWNEQQEKKEQNHQSQSSPIPLKFPMDDDEAHLFSPTSNNGLPNNNDMEKENEQHRWSKHNTNISYQNNKQFPQEVEQPET